MKATARNKIYQFYRAFPTKGQKGLASPSGDGYILVRTLDSCILTPTHRETIRRILSKTTRKRRAQLNIRFFPNYTVSKKPLGTRMGTGKGRPESKVSCLHKGRPLFAIKGKVPLTIVKPLYQKIKFRLPIDSKLILNKKIENRNQEYKLETFLKHYVI